MGATATRWVMAPLDGLPLPGVARTARTGRLLRGTIGVAAFLAVGELVGRSGIVSQRYLPPTSDVLSALVSIVGDGFAADVWTTTRHWLIGLLVAVAIGVPLGLLLGSVPLLNTASRVAVEFLRPIPSVALIPVAAFAWGNGTQMRVFVMVFAAVWPILFNTIYGLMEVDPLAKETARSFGMGRFGIAVTVSLPSAAPFILTGVRLGAAIALIIEVTAELYAGGPGGIGVAAGVMYAAGRIDMVLAATLVAGLLGLLGNTLLELLGRRGLAWAHAGRQS